MTDCQSLQKLVFLYKPSLIAKIKDIFKKVFYPHYFQPLHLKTHGQKMLSVCYVSTTVIANSIKKDFFNTCCSSRAQSNFVLIVSAKWSFIKLSTLILLPEQYFSYLMMLLTFEKCLTFS